MSLTFIFKVKLSQFYCFRCIQIGCLNRVSTNMLAFLFLHFRQGGKSNVYILFRLYQDYENTVYNATLV